MFGRQETPWWDGRAVVRRGDVPSVDVESLNLIKTDEERLEIAARMATVTIGFVSEEDARRKTNELLEALAQVPGPESSDSFQ